MSCYGYIRSKKMYTGSNRIRSEKGLKFSQKKCNTDDETDLECKRKFGRNHPYDGRINFKHLINQVLKEGFYILTEAKYLHLSYRMDLSFEEEYSRPQRCLQNQYDHAEIDLRNLYYTAHRAEVDAAHDTRGARIKPGFSDETIGQVECEGYRGNAQDYVDEAKRRLSMSKTPKEKEVHSKKLQLFESMLELQKISIVPEHLKGPRFTM
ncbi:hypothetical protein BgiMline_032330 [Biomphalaria glabrata]|uniref:Uncharacterized protein LOC106066501 n=1 Tax=Biomphalaria glabrata TaxID=6526 RepID=A0A9U8EBP0_BIOGL|nr:uncharacterized protein LOC106066501 [Biomphalaria glabrata]KAI8750821.1 hypothetical protein BgiMline_015352 [Biomphalaria glabrata]